MDQFRSLHEEPAGALARRLRDRLDSTLAPLLPRGTRAALINYPNHHNVGDPALYLGTLRTLRRLGVHVTYRCEHSAYSRASLASELGRGTQVILINGGGNLGDQYPQQLGRERVLSDFPGVPTIQLSQSIWFRDQARLEQFARLVAGHGDLTLLLRDQASLEIARRQFDARSSLCPDMAMGIGPLVRPRPPSQDLLWLRRADREAAHDSEPSAYEAYELETEPSVDWLTAMPHEAVGGRSGRWLLGVNKGLRRSVARAGFLWRPLAWTFEPLARRRLDFGCRLLAKGRVVVSDRLHAVLLALLMDIPAVAVDNSNHKVASFFATWLSDARSVRMARDHGEALALARELMSAVGPGTPRDGPGLTT